MLSLGTLFIQVHALLLHEKPECLRTKIQLWSELHDRQLAMRDPYKLAVPCHRTAKYEGSFTYMAPTLYNILPIYLWSFSLTSFREKIAYYVREHF